MNMMVEERFKFRDELLAAAVKHLEAVAGQQNSAALNTVLANLKQGQIIEAEPVFVSVTQAYEKSDAITSAQKAATWINLAAIRLYGKPEGVDEALRRALELDGDNVQALALLAHLALTNRQTDEAESFALKAVSKPATGVDVKWQAVAFEDLGVLHHMKGDFDKAETYYSKAISGFEQAGDEINAAEARGNLGLILRRERKFKEAVELFEKSLAVWEKHGREKELVLTLGYLGSLHFILRDYRDAIEIFTKRAKLNEAKKDTAELAADYANMGNAWSKLANMLEALNHWQQAERLYGAVGKAKEAKIVADLLAKHACSQGGLM